jgi:proteasome lid subunit RPN8/RPN11
MTQPASAVPFSVEMAAEVQRRIRQHARAFMDAEICGVLIGTMQPGSTIVENVIRGEGARQAGTHVTFTQETWAHIYEVKDARFPNARIVGWYHSHPSFGIFLSDHDLFIHKNFFSDPNQIAWVFDPHSEEEGCFVWERDEIVRAARTVIAMGAAGDTPHDAWEQPTANTTVHNADTEPVSPKPTWHSRVVRWSLVCLSYLAVLALGYALGFLLTPIIVIPSAPGPAQHPPTQENRK